MRFSFVRALVLIILCAQLSGCTKYWWQRGQPKSVTQLFQASDEKLSDALGSFRAVRPDIAEASESIQKELQAAVAGLQSGKSKQPLSAQLPALEQSFMELEGKLSIGSRAAYGELSGQLRSLSKASASGETPSFASFGTFAARTLSFLANELSVPAPVIAS